MNEKLQKVLARAGHGSRRELEALIKAGRVSVNGVVAKLGERLEDENAVVRIDGHIVSAKAQEEVIVAYLRTTSLRVNYVLVMTQKVAALYLTVCRKSAALAGFQLAVLMRTHPVYYFSQRMVNLQTV